MTKQKRVALLAGVAAMALGSTAANALTEDGYAGGGSAAVTAMVTNLGVPQYWDTDPLTPDYSTLLTGYHAYLVTINVESSLPADVISGIDFGGGGVAGNDKIITAPLHQDWMYTYDSKAKKWVSTPTPTDSYNGPVRIDSVSGAPVGWDSYFIMPTSIVIPPDQVGFLTSQPTEDNPGTGSPYSPNAFYSNELYGVGTQMYTTYGLGVDSQATTLDVAYLVIPDSALLPDGSLHLADAVIAVGGADYTTSVDIPGSIPEIPLPGAVYLGMAGLGLVAVYTRRRMA